jgi:hypothetical protein
VGKGATFYFTLTSRAAREVVSPDAMTNGANS